jgi:hypothetical protein
MAILPARTLYFRIRLRIDPPLPTSGGQRPFRFSVPQSKAETDPAGDSFPARVDIEISSAGDATLTTARLRVSDELFTLIYASAVLVKLPSHIVEEYQAHALLLCDATERVVALLSQELRAFGSHLSARNQSSDSWSEDGTTWRALDAYVGELGLRFRAGNPGLDEVFERGTQRLLDEGYSALAASYFLHLAHKESEPRVRWLYAATAAELAVREVIELLDPAFGRARMKELVSKQTPGAPRRGTIEVLYSDGLQAVSGTPSPFVEQLRHGAKIRNDIVHNPTAVHMSGRQAREYVAQVDKAIRDLLRRLRPDIRPYIDAAETYMRRG